MTRAQYKLFTGWSDGEQEWIVLVDLDEGMTITNDAERVVEDLVKLEIYERPGARVVYRDTAGEWAELLVLERKFNGFAPASLDTLHRLRGMHLRRVLHTGTSMLDDKTFLQLLTAIARMEGVP